MHALMPTAAGFLLVLMRCAGLCMTAPLLGTRTIPNQIRISLSLSLAVVAFMAAGGPAFSDWDQTSALVAAAFGETLLGLSAGLAARITIEAASGAGHIIGMSMGLGFGASIDPLHGTESTAVQELLAFITLGVAVGIGLHREAVAWLCRSVIVSPPGTSVSLPELAANVVAAATGSAALAIRMAFPVMVAVTFGHAALGVLNRAAPQLNLSNIGFSIAILAGGGALYFVAPGIADMAASAARVAFVGNQ